MGGRGGQAGQCLFLVPRGLKKGMMKTVQNQSPRSKLFRTPWPREDLPSPPLAQYNKSAV